MKLQPSKEPRSTRARTQDVVRPVAEPVPDSAIPWEAMVEAVKVQFKVQFFENAKTDNPESEDLVANSDILILFPELEQDLRLTQEDCERWIKAGEGNELDPLELLQPLLRIFPKQKQRILEAYQERIRLVEEKLVESSKQKPPPYAFCLFLLSRLPDHFDQYKDILSLGTNTVLEYIRHDDIVRRVLLLMSDLVLFFPDTRSQVQSILKERRKEIGQMLGDMMGMMDTGDPNESADVTGLSQQLACLKIIYADSAGYREDGSIFIEDKKPPISQKPGLPSRDLAL